MENIYLSQTGILPRVDIINRMDYLWLAIPRIALADMLLRSMTQVCGMQTCVREVDILCLRMCIYVCVLLTCPMAQDGLRIGDGGLLTSNLVPPEVLPLYIELCTIKHTMAASDLSQLEAATFRRIVVHGGVCVCVCMCVCVDVCVCVLVCLCVSNNTLLYSSVWL